MAQVVLLERDQTIPKTGTEFWYRARELRLTESPPLPSRQGVSVGEAVRTLDYWLLFLIYVALAGPGSMVCNNFVQIFISRNRSLREGGTYVKDGGGDGEDIPHYEVVTLLVTLFAVANTAGRIISGYLTDWSVQRGVHRSVCLAGAGVVMAAALVLFALGNVPYVAVVPLGLCVGATFATVPMLVGELFGMRAFATIWGCMMLAPAIGTLALSGALSAQLEERHMRDSWVWVRDSPDKEPVKYCYGDACLRDAFLIQAGICAAAAVAAAALCLRHRQPSHPPVPAPAAAEDGSETSDDVSGGENRECVKQRLLQ